ncbi:MAG: hypothetical protein OEZ47_10805 [Gammaproteobacteria bacterium]|nr:hypothetical protein [Gammaproteobacteria bacterium]
MFGPIKSLLRDETLSILLDSHISDIDDCRTLYRSNGKTTLCVLSDLPVNKLSDIEIAKSGFFSPYALFSFRSINSHNKKVVPIRLHKAIEDEGYFDSDFKLRIDHLKGNGDEFSTQLVAVSEPELTSLRNRLGKDQNLQQYCSTPVESAITDLLSKLIGNDFAFLYFSPPFYSLNLVVNSIVVKRTVERFSDSHSDSEFSLGNFNTSENDAQKIKNTIDLFLSDSANFSSYDLEHVIACGQFPDFFCLDQNRNETDTRDQNEYRASISDLEKLKPILRKKYGTSFSLEQIAENLDLFSIDSYKGKINFLDENTKNSTLTNYFSKHVLAASFLFFSFVGIYQSIIAYDSYQIFQDVQARQRILSEEIVRTRENLPTKSQVDNITLIAKLVERQKQELRLDHLLEWLSKSAPKKSNIGAISVTPYFGPDPSKNRIQKAVPGKFLVNLSAGFRGSYKTAKKSSDYFVTSLKKKSSIITTSFSYEQSNAPYQATLSASVLVTTKDFYGG